MASHAVPRTSEVIPGALVNIVLKADQPTGRQVRGIVRDVLTRGDHYRGIKVRLADGRIGRVQSLASPSSPAANEDGVVQTSETPASGAVALATSGGRRQRPRYRDIRLDEPDEMPQEQLELSAYIKPAKRRGKGKNAPSLANHGAQAQSDDDGLSTAADVSTATATCPVCGAFEGDEAAVAHHVSQHFE
ncbi:hypothetical protein GGR56DRAFT_669343 [Xylariaceae sp. FL0804]|nr:hypothetical protein GGR56DRAFT_669343 [Xylariaceae sp. FL0804]